MQKGIWKFGGAFLLMAAALGAQDSVGAGTYKGQWSGGSGGGAIQITFRADAKGALIPEVGVTVDGQSVDCKVRSYKIDGAKFSFVSEFDNDGDIIRANVEATVKGKTLTGTFQASNSDGVVDSGTWKATAP
jgi:hypothetical protein